MLVAKALFVKGEPNTRVVRESCKKVRELHYVGSVCDHSIIKKVSNKKRD